MSGSRLFLTRLVALAAGMLLTGCCCLGLESDPDLVLPAQPIPPIADAQVAARAVADATGTAPFAVTLDASGSSDADGTIVKYDWDFDNDGEIDLADGGVSVPFDYDTAGVFTARVVVTDDDGLTDDDTTVITANPALVPPNAVASATAQGVGSTLADLDGSSSTDADGTITTYDWDFDNDGTYDLLDGGVSPMHDFGAFGTFTIGLRVTDNDGLTDTTTTTVTLVEPDNVPPVAAVAPTPASGTADPQLDVVWDASASTDSDGTIVSYDWDMDNDGTFEITNGGTTQNASYTTTGIKTVGVRVTDDDGATDTATADCDVNVPPVAALSANPPSGTAAQILDVTWDASASTDSDGTIVNYDWDMDNDGTFEITNGGTSQNAQYTTTGIKTVGVRVTDDDGATDETTATCDVNIPPVANLVPSPPAGFKPLNVTWDASTSTDSDGTIVQFDWDMDNDGTFEITNGGPTQSPAAYNTIGTVTVGVRVTDDDGATAQTTAQVTVDGTPPTAAVSGTWQQSGFAPDTADWDASASFDNDGTIVQYDWDLDNDSIFETLNGGPTQSVFYASPGTKIVNVRVTDDDGFTDTETASLELLQFPD